MARPEPTKPDDRTTGGGDEIRNPKRPGDIEDIGALGDQDLDVDDDEEFEDDEDSEEDADLEDGEKDVE